MLKNPVIAFLKLIRIENLLIIAITQFCIKYFVFAPLNEYSNLTPWLFSVLVLSTVLIAAAGYIINDYFDVKTDKINHPDTVVVDVVIKRRWAMVLHILFNFIGLVLGFYLALKAHHLRLLVFQIVSIILLWFYSTHFKKRLLIGNIVVSLLTATIPILPMAYDYYMFDRELIVIAQAMLGQFFNTLIFVGIVYAIFAFLTSFAREVIKDMEDYKGDKQTGCKTMPIVWGILTSKVVTFFVIVITIGLLTLVCFKLYQLNFKSAIYYITGLVILPLIILLFQTIKAQSSRDFKIASLLLKFTMLFGIAFTYIIKFLYD